MVSVCSVENPGPPENHDIVGQNSEDDFSALGVILTGSKRGAEVTLDQAMNGFTLPALPIGRVVAGAGVGEGCAGVVRND